MTTKPEILAKHKWVGAYDITGEARLVRNDDKTYLVIDHFCGMDRAEGGTLRPHVYAVPTDRIEEILACFARPDDEATDDPIDGTNWDYLDSIILADLRCYGRKSYLSWAKDF